MCVHINPYVDTYDLPSVCVGYAQFPREFHVAAAGRLLYAPVAVVICTGVHAVTQPTCAEAGPRRLGDQAMLGILTYLRIPPLVNTPENPSPPKFSDFFT